MKKLFLIAILIVFFVPLVSAQKVGESACYCPLLACIQPLADDPCFDALQKEIGACLTSKPDAYYWKQLTEKLKEKYPECAEEIDHCTVYEEIGYSIVPCKGSEVPVEYCGASTQAVWDGTDWIEKTVCSSSDKYCKQTYGEDFTCYEKVSYGHNGEYIDACYSCRRLENISPVRPGIRPKAPSYLTVYPYLLLILGGFGFVAFLLFKYWSKK